MNPGRLLVAAALTLFGCSCAWKKAPDPVTAAPLDAADEVRGRELAAAFAEGFISAVKSGDFEQWRPLIPESRRGGLTAEVFARIRRELAETLGELREGTYFGVLRKGDLHDHLWKLSFVRDGKTRDALFLVRVFREKNAPPEIGGFGVKRF